jgi:voltage-gated potassium channel
MTCREVLGKTPRDRHKVGAHDGRVIRRAADSVPRGWPGASPSGPGPACRLSLPSRTESPLAAVAKRLLLAVSLVAISTVIVYLGRQGYRDAAHPGRPLSLLGSVYYATVTLSTTGFGDIVPISARARLVNTVVITPIRVLFLVVLVGTTLEVLTERTRTNWRIGRWRSNVHAQTIVIGYGTKGRSAVRTMVQSGTDRRSIVVVDESGEAIGDANAAGLVAVVGDGTRREVLAQAKITSATKVVIAVHRDDTSVLITLTARHLNPSATIVAAVREEENQDLLRQSGADQVVVSSGAAGQLLAISAVRPAAGRVMADLLDRGRGLDLVERPVTEAEAGLSARDVDGTVVAVVRDDELVVADHPAARHLARGDRMILVSAHHQPDQCRQAPESEEPADAASRV